MLASELIKKLQAKIYEHGDLPVYLPVYVNDMSGPQASSVMKSDHKFIITNMEGV